MIWGYHHFRKETPIYPSPSRSMAEISVVHCRTMLRPVLQEMLHGIVLVGALLNWQRGVSWGLGESLAKGGRFLFNTTGGHTFQKMPCSTVSHFVLFSLFTTCFFRSFKSLLNQQQTCRVLLQELVHCIGWGIHHQMVCLSGAAHCSPPPSSSGKVSGF